MKNKVLIGIGSNIGNGIKNCMEAIKKISTDKRVDLKKISSFYTTSPVSEIKQDDFINCAILIDWKDTPKELLELLLNIENAMGRKRETKDGPRIIDLDILLFGDTILDEPFLTIPHKELHKRKFALVPCLEIDPHYIHPVHKRPLNDFLLNIGNDQIITKLPGIGFSEELEGA
jgi:2-amino-4-hydroxy-6-hydroxymethyldihydropteridine diphosphokinase